MTARQHDRSDLSVSITVKAWSRSDLNSSIGVSRKDLNASIQVCHTDSANLDTTLGVRVVGSNILNASLDVGQTAVKVSLTPRFTDQTDLPSTLSVRRRATADLPGSLIVISEFFAASITVKQRTQISGSLSVRQTDVSEVLATINVAEPRPETQLPATITVRRSDFKDLDVGITVRYSDKSDLLAHLEVRQSSYVDLPVVIGVVFRGTEDFPTEATVRRSDQVDLLAQVGVTKRDSTDLSTSFSVIYRGATDLPSEIAVRQSETTDLPADIRVLTQHIIVVKLSGLLKDTILLEGKKKCIYLTGTRKRYIFLRGPGSMSFEIYKGDSVVLDVTIYEESGVPADLTGCVVRFAVKALATDPDDKILITKTSEIGTEIDIDKPTQGHMFVYLKPSDTNLTVGTYQYDIRVLTPVGDVYTTNRGELKIKSVVRYQLS